MSLPLFVLYSMYNRQNWNVRMPTIARTTLSYLFIYLKVFSKYQSNIARGTTDPGYRIYNLNKFSGWNQFDIILTKREEERIRLRHIYCGNNWESMVRKCVTQSIGKGSHPLLLHPVIQLVHISLIIGIVDMYKMQENKNQYFYEKSSTPPSDNPSERCFC